MLDVKYYISILSMSNYIIFLYVMLFNTLCHILLFDVGARLCYAFSRYVISYCAVSCYIMLRYAILCHIMSYYLSSCSITLCCVVLCYTMLYRAVLCFVMLCYVLLYKVIPSYDM